MKFIILFCFIALVDAVKLPSYYKKCKRSDPNFEKCMIDNAEAGIKNFALNGEPSLKLPGIKPLKINSVSAQASPQLAITLNNLEFVGYETMKFKHISFTDDAFMLNLTFPHYIITANYDMSGRILILPISGKGTCSIESDSVDYSYHVHLKKGDKNGKMYYKIDSENIEINPKKIVWTFNNLFNGDKALGDQMNIFLNDNWFEVYEETKVPILEILKNIFHKYVGNHLTKIPISDLVE